MSDTAQAIWGFAVFKAISIKNKIETLAVKKYCDLFDIM